MITFSQYLPKLLVNRVLQVCKKSDDAFMALEVLRMFNRRYKTFSKSRSSILYPTLMMAARKMTRMSPYEARTQQLPQTIGSLFLDMRQLIAAGAPRPEEEVFVELALAFSHMGETERLLETLIEMTAVRHEPSLSLCDGLLEQALWTSDIKILKVLIGWYLNNFEISLDIGRVNRIMHTASNRGDEELARLGFQLLSHSGHPTEMVSYVCWARACISCFNVNGAIEALMEAQGQDLDILNSAHGSSLQNELASTFKSTTTALDGIYFALVDLRRGNYIVPPIVINALIMAAGKLNQLDRAFGTFQEYESLFGHKPDIHAHNALLYAISHSKFPE
jgi:hypothetical protein